MLIKPLQIRTWSKIGMEKAFYGIGLMEVAKECSDIYAITADRSTYSGLDRFARTYPDKFINIGIQEQNMLGVACGLALEGNQVYAGTYASFAVVRAMEQVRHDMSIMNTDIKLVGARSGYASDTLGRSHWATEDVSLTRCLPNMTIVVPADATEAVKTCLAVSKIKGPCYIRLSGGSTCPSVYQQDYDFQIGKSIRLHEGTDTAIFAAGLMVTEALKAAELLEKQGIFAEVINMHTIKPLDTEAVERAAGAYRHIYTVEEHTVIGGLGSAVAEWMAEHPHNCALHRIGMQDCIYRIGSPEYTWRQAGMCGDQIAETIIKNLEGETQQ